MIQGYIHPGMQVRHIRTGGLYEVLGTVKVKTGDSDWVEAVLYKPHALDNHNTFARDVGAFKTNFEVL